MYRFFCQIMNDDKGGCCLTVTHGINMNHKLMKFVWLKSKILNRNFVEKTTDYVLTSVEIRF